MFILVPKKSDERLVGNSGVMLKVKALSSISIEDVELGVGDADQSTAPKVYIVKIFHRKSFKTSNMLFELEKYSIVFFRYFCR